MAENLGLVIVDLEVPPGLAALVSVITARRLALAVIFPDSRCGACALPRNVLVRREAARGLAAGRRLLA
jgi:hypothetical protein